MTNQPFAMAPNLISIHRKIKYLLFVFFAFVLAFVQIEDLSAIDDLSFEVTLSKKLGDKPISGRLFVFASKQGEPRMGPNWFRPEPFFGLDVVEMKPDETKSLDDNADCFPVPISKLPNGTYRLQALLDQDFYAPSPGTGVGNLYSEVVEIEITETTKSVPFVLTEVVKARPFVETDFVKLVSLDSKLLGKFHQRQVLEKAAVILPASYLAEPERRYPVFYEITGFGGTLYNSTVRYRRRKDTGPSKDFEYIHVILTGECKWGHHVYANSATNGPRGDAFVKEMIPLIDSKFRTVSDASARYVGGHSSGGWSSIWLQVNYPDDFGGLWSTAPDPVDFRDYQQTNLYSEEPESIYFFADKSKKPLARNGSQVMIWYPDFAKMDDTLGRGGQLRSFEAVFSPLDDKGLPARMWNRQTGKVDPKVVDAWKKYDIQLLLRNKWTTLAPKLSGKMHVLMGTEDTFYLDGATKLLGETLKELGSDAEVILVPGSHGSILTGEYIARRKKQMEETFLKHFNLDGTAKK